MHLENNRKKTWEHIISEVTKTEVPIECIKKVVIRLHNKRQQTINLNLLRKQGLDSTDIEALINRNLLELEPEIKDLDFIIDPMAVADLIEPETQKLLDKLK